MTSNNPFPKNSSSVAVALDGLAIGTLSTTSRGYLFQYTETYQQSAKPIPLSITYPLEAEPEEYAFAGELPVFFNHLLPEGWLKDIAESAKLPMETSLQKLASLCQDNLGATEIYGPTPTRDLKILDLQKIVTNRRNPDSGKNLLIHHKHKQTATVPWKHCVYCHSKLPTPGFNQNFHEDCSQQFYGMKIAPSLDISSDALADIAKQQLADHQSLTGVQPKFSAIFKHGRGSLSDQSFIIKPEPQIERKRDGVTYQHSAVAELATMHFAEILGLKIADCALIYLKDSQPALIVKRFDRDQGSKIHTEDFAQALSIRNKYNGSHEKIAAILKKNTNQDHKQSDLEAFLKVTILNFIVGNCDGHLKNFSLIHTYNQTHTYELSPFYDLLPIRMFARKDPNQLALPVGGKSNRLKRDDFIKLSIKMGININIMNDFIDDIKVNLQNYLDPFSFFGVPKKFTNELKAYCQERIQDLSELGAKSK